MKNNVLMSLVFSFVLLASAVALFAEPQIDVSLSSSLPIPHAYDEVIKLPGGDLQFYKISVSNGNIQIEGFQYLVRSNTLTDLVQIGTISGIPGTIQWEGCTQRFGKYYAFYQYPESNPEGFVIIRLDGNNLEYRLIDNMQLGDYCSLRKLIDIVSEDHFVIALEDSLVFYNFTNDTHRTLLDGEDYQYDGTWGRRVYAMPTGHFMFVKDMQYGINAESESWMIFDSEGNYLFTKWMADPWCDISMIGTSFNACSELINGRFYIPSPGLDMHLSTVFECHFPTPDSLYVYTVPPLYDHFLGLTGFGDDRIIQKYFDYNFEATGLFMCFSPLEHNHQPSNWTFIRSYDLHLDSFNEDILMVSSRYEDYIFTSALCTWDFPAPHTFTFLAPDVSIYLQSSSFIHEDQFFFISDDVLYVFEVDYSVSNADETAVPPAHSLSAYPNPVGSEDVITFKASVKDAIELDIYNIRGQKVNTVILDSEGKADWNLRSHKGEVLSTGVYFAKVRDDLQIKPIKFVVLR